MAHDAWEELEKIDKKERLDFVAFWKVQVEVARALGKWELVAEVARRLSKIEPDESLHVLNLGQAMRQLGATSPALVSVPETGWFRLSFAPLEIHSCRLPPPCRGETIFTSRMCPKTAARTSPGGAEASTVLIIERG
jgi:hypothetical protein